MRAHSALSTSAAARTKVSSPSVAAHRGDGDARAGGSHGATPTSAAARAATPTAAAAAGAGAGDGARSRLRFALADLTLGTTLGACIAREIATALLRVRGGVGPLSLFGVAVVPVMMSCGDTLLSGTGTFGRVRIVLHKETRKYMALKILKKSEVSGGGGGGGGGRPS
jgi:hypothetical protein